jgi:hypothetical protein
MICGNEAWIFSVGNTVICFPTYIVFWEDNIESCTYVTGYERKCAFSQVVPPFYLMS